MGVIGGWRTPAGLLSGTLPFAVGQSLAFSSLAALAVGRVGPTERGAVFATMAAFLGLAFGMGALTLRTLAGTIGIGGGFLVAPGGRGRRARLDGRRATDRSSMTGRPGVDKARSSACTSPVTALQGWQRIMVYSHAIRSGTCPSQPGGWPLPSRIQSSALAPMRPGAPAAD